MTLELLLFQSVLGPIGLPATEAVYTGVTAAEKPEGVPEENWLPIDCLYGLPDAVSCQGRD